MKENLTQYGARSDAQRCTVVISFQPRPPADFRPCASRPLPSSRIGALRPPLPPPVVAVPRSRPGVSPPGCEPRDTHSGDGARPHGPRPRSGNCCSFFHRALQGDSGGGRIRRLVDLDLRSSPCLWAATVATYCPSRRMEHPKSKSTRLRYSTTRVTL